MADNQTHFEFTARWRCSDVIDHKEGYVPVQKEELKQPCYSR